MSHEIRWLDSLGDWDAHGEQTLAPTPDIGVPTASFSAAVAGDTVTVNGMTSSSTVGSITTWEWDFGDGTSDDTTDVGTDAKHTYAVNGTYTITLTVTNSDGITDTTSQSVTIDKAPPPPPPDQAPVAAFTSQISGLAVAVDASASKDPDGSIVDYSWDFGDPVLPGNKFFASAYLGGSGRLATNNSTAASNLAAVIESCTLNANVLTVSGHATGTTGTISTYTWHWGDQTSVGGTASSTHTYSALGDYLVTFTVTDSLGGAASIGQNVTVASMPATPPDANFIWSQYAGQSAISVDGRGSNVGSGTSITSYSWNWGDGTAASTGAQSGHTYTSYGTYQVTLTVTNNLGVTNAQVTTVPVTATTPANKPPIASFTTTQSDLRVNVDASASSDPDGSIVKYDWNFTQSTYSTTNPVANGYYYNQAGTYTIKLTVTDDKGATGTTSKSVTVTAPIAGNTSGNGDLGGNGATPSGTNIQNLSGSTFSAKVNSAGSGATVALPSGTYTFKDFADGGGYIGALLTVKGLRGAGSKFTTVQMEQNSSTKTAPTASGTTNNFEYVKFDNVQNGAVIDGIMFNGTPQPHMPLYNGPQFAHVQGNLTVSNCTFKGFPGNTGYPPGETFGMAVWHEDVTSSVINFTNCTFDGKQTDPTTGTVTKVGASNSGVNDMSGTINFTDCLFVDSNISAGLAMWKMASGSVLNLVRPVFRTCYRNLGNEAQGGTINIYDPIFGQPTHSGEDDIRITWTDGFNSGRINVYFTSQANVDACFGPRTTKKIMSECGFGSYGASGVMAYTGSNNIQNFCSVYIGGVKQTLSNYWQFSGKWVN